MKLFKIILTLFIAAVLLNACQKEYSVESGGTKLPIGNWEFVNGSSAYAGNMDTAYIDTTGTTKELHLNGTSSNGTQNFQMVLYADSFNVGTYKASLFQSSFNYTSKAKTIYQANQLVGEFIVTVTSFSNNLIIGTFSGTALDSSNSLKQLTQGKFKAILGSGIVLPSSTGVLGDSSGNCKPVILNGTYTQGISAISANTVQIQVVVAVAGSYSISTNSVNGIAFSGMGTFTNTGSQNVILYASGTPQLSGNQVYTLQYGNSQCAFTVNFLPGVAPSGDYFPLTLNTNWTFSLIGGTSSDSVFQQVINYSPAFGGNNYQAIALYNVPFTSAASDSFYYRKPGGDYYQYMNYSTFFAFDQPVTGEFIFLKDNVPATTTWQSPTISGTISGLPLSGYAKMTLLEKAVPVTIGIYNFPDVIKIKYEYFITGTPVALLTQERWFARNVGEIYKSSNNGVITTQYQVGTFLIF